MQEEQKLLNATLQKYQKTGVPTELTLGSNQINHPSESRRNTISSANQRINPQIDRVSTEVNRKHGGEILVSKTIAEKSRAIIRLRPLTKREEQNGFSTQIIEFKNGALIDSLQDAKFQLHQSLQIYGEVHMSECIYESLKLEQQIWNSIEHGLNLTILGYGHTGAGKSHTMFGNKDKAPGILPLSLESIFAFIYEKVENEFLVRLSYLEIYNEQVNDLFAPNVSRSAGSHLEQHFTEEICTNIDQMFSLIRMGDINRQIGTKVNDRQAKAHLIVKIIIESFTYKQQNLQSPTNTLPQCIINIVDLAGSECLMQDGSPERGSQSQVKEASYGVKSMMTLDQIIQMQAHGTSEWIPYRESKLTKFLMPYLEGDSQMLWICCISPTDCHYKVNKRTIEFANQIPKVQQKVKCTLISLEESTLFQVKKKIATMKLRLSKLEVHIQKKEQQYLNSTKGSISPKSAGSSSRSAKNQLNSSSLSGSLDQEIDEKMRLLTDIKKLQNQILVSDKVSPYLKKFDKRRTLARQTFMAQSRPLQVLETTTTEVETNENLQESTLNSQKKRTSLYDRMSKKLENAREFVRNNAEEQSNKVGDNEDETDEDKMFAHLRSSRKSQSRLTLKKIQENLENEELFQLINEDSKDEGNFKIGRLSVFDKIIGSEENPDDDQNNKNSSIIQGILGGDTPLMQGIDEIVNDPFLNALNPLSDQQPKLGQGNVRPYLRPENSSEDENDSVEDDEEIISETSRDSNGKEAKEYFGMLDDDTFFAIKEEDEEDEDSFELDRKQQKLLLNRINQSKEFITDDKSLNNAKQAEDVTPVDESKGESRKTILTTAQRRKSSIRKSRKSKNCAKCNEEIIRTSVAENEQRFLESLLESRDVELASLKEQLRQRDVENQVLQNEKAELIRQLNEAKANQNI